MLEDDEHCEKLKQAAEAVEARVQSDLNDLLEQMSNLERDIASKQRHLENAHTEACSFTESFREECINSAMEELRKVEEAMIAELRSNKT